MSATALVRKSRLLFYILGAVTVLAVAGWLRFDTLNERPLHFDEGINARILAERLEHQTYEFNPSHFHGPLLSVAALQTARLRGESSWPELTVPTLRLTVAVCGLLLVVVTFLFRPLLRPGAGLAAAAFVATSPLLVYYSGMFIHEIPFALFGAISLMALLALLERPCLLYAALFGAGAGLMASTRETVVISLLAWAIASLIWLRQTHSGSSVKELARHVWKVKVPLLVFAAALGLVLVVIHYSDFMRHPAGVLEFFKTFFVYTPEAGHEKPASYFVQLLLWPKVSGGVWWTEIGVLLFALYGYFRYPAGTCRVACWFLFHAGLIHFVVYSLIAYKTPWLVCLAWVHLCLAAGMGVVQLLVEARGRWKIPAAALVLAVLCWQGVQSHRVISRFASDARNPYAYVPTSIDLVRMTDWLDGLAERNPELNAEPVAVVGSYYWPLPWYLRGFDRIGYWKETPEGSANMPLLLVLPADELDALEATHVLFPRGLRHEVPVTVAIRKDIWERELLNDAP